MKEVNNLNNNNNMLEAGEAKKEEKCLNVDINSDY